MTEDRDKNEITTDDLNALRVVLKSVKGISAVSSTAVYIPSREPADE